MRIACLSALLLVASCTDWNPAYSTGGDGAVAVDDAGGQQQQPPADLANSPAPTPDLAKGPAPTPDLAMPGGGGGMGMPCKTACDCQAGLQCGWNGQCTKAWQAVYCCDAQMCPKGSTCQSSAGKWGQCGMTMGGGGANYCQYIPCQNDTLCKQAGCGSCEMTKRVCQ